ncbi:MAG: hypothetical protein M3416_00135 [Acidobacteriota bacterium]|nr:hypothetical protein [Acidobacteriota bacterium]
MTGQPTNKAKENPSTTGVEAPVAESKRTDTPQSAVPERLQPSTSASAGGSPPSAPVRKSAGKKLTHKIVGVTGDLSSSPKFLLGMLFLYFAMWLALFLALHIQLFEFENAGFIAYEIATGADPFNFKDLGKHPLIWTLISILHVMSWLVLPVVIAVVIDATYRIYEERRLRAEKKVKRRIRQIGREHLGLSGDALEEFVEEEYDSMEEEEE